MAIGENIERLELFIFNRWGELIYQSYYREPWNGKMNDVDCQIDVYVWKVNYKFTDEKFYNTEHGHVTLVR